MSTAHSYYSNPRFKGFIVMMCRMRLMHSRSAAELISKHLYSSMVASS